ncbi:hypothetical protein CEP70_02020 [Providencia stuartii]|nr:hypothetical protein BGK56_09675 [Providencia stuartii]AVL38867.1 hypothetical protein CEP70_02020 [Providencia stuartii]KNZ87429.1 hypothetical protein AFL46_03110 [Providencia stuartii]KSX99250.1 hypothetical protein APT95_07850 [Providencia stuartii]
MALHIETKNPYSLYDLVIISIQQEHASRQKMSIFSSKALNNPMQIGMKKRYLLINKNNALEV